MYNITGDMKISKLHSLGSERDKLLGLIHAGINTCIRGMDQGLQDRQPAVQLLGNLAE